MLIHKEFLTCAQRNGLKPYEFAYQARLLNSSDLGNRLAFIVWVPGDEKRGDVGENGLIFSRIKR